MYFEEIGTVDDAIRESLVPITVWLMTHEIEWLKKELYRIGSNEMRKAMIIKRNGLYALFVNDITGRYGKYNEEGDIDLDD